MRLAPFRTLVDATPEWTINTPPLLSQAELSQVRATTKEAISRIQRRLRGMVLLAIVIPVLAIYGGWLLALAAVIGAGYYADKADNILADLRRLLAQVQPIQQQYCEKMLTLCNSTREGREYREQVLSAGREFVQGDYLLLETWSDPRVLQAACAALYFMDKEDPSCK